MGSFTKWPLWQELSVRGQELLSLPSGWSGLEVEQLGFKSVPTWDAGAVDGGLACYATAPAPLAVASWKRNTRIVLIFPFNTCSCTEDDYVSKDFNHLLRQSWR